jgi:endonuclease/exonuclease/phosphatase family metal-dependent hydrolase
LKTITPKEFGERVRGGADLRQHLRTRRTYPGALPFLHLDHIYYEHTLELERLTLHRSRLSLVADFRLTTKS